LKNASCNQKGCDGKLKSKPKKKPTRIQKPYVIGMVIAEGRRIGAVRSAFWVHPRSHIYLVNTIGEVCFPRPVIRGKWDTPVTYFPTGLQVENPGGYAEDVMFMEVVCIGHASDPVLVPRNPEMDPAGVEPEFRKMCSHCNDYLNECRTRKRWIPVEAYERLLKRKDEV
jgi:hypothetical protein